jgi:alcohol dehydrogenase
MDAVVLCGPRLVKVLRMPKPVLTDSDDVIVKVKYAGLCGSDLHPYRGDEKGCDYGGTIMGHECAIRLTCHLNHAMLKYSICDCRFVGYIVEKGSGVSGLELGDLVCAPFTTSCGTAVLRQPGLSYVPDDG